MNTDAVAQEILPHLLRDAELREPAMIARMRTLVEMESPTTDKAAVNRVAAHVAQWCRELSGATTLHRHETFGDSLEVSFTPQRPTQRPILLLGHLDTVWDTGTLRTQPWRESEDRIFGPGVLDMKAGVVMAIAAVEMLLARNALHRTVSILLNADEEAGSTESRNVTESVAKRCEAVYVLEPAQGEKGAYKTARKGTGQYRLRVEGVPAHSGVDFSRGHSAILELARQLQTVATFTDLARGTTVNTGRMGGGTRINVVPAEAWAEVEMRFVTPEDAAEVARKFRALAAVDPACRLTVEGGIDCPPMVRTPATVRLFEQARQLALALHGLPLHEAATGGSSDGNFTSAIGVPTLDGMGAVGAGAHAPHEHIVRRHIAPRTALLAAMLC